MYKLTIFAGLNNRGAIDDQLVEWSLVEVSGFLLTKCFLDKTKKPSYTVYAATQQQFPHRDQ